MMRTIGLPAELSDANMQPDLLPHTSADVVGAAGTRIVEQQMWAEPLCIPTDQRISAELAP